MNQLHDIIPAYLLSYDYSQYTKDYIIFYLTASLRFHVEVAAHCSGMGQQVLRIQQSAAGMLLLQDLFVKTTQCEM